MGAGQRPGPRREPARPWADGGLESRGGRQGPGKGASAAPPLHSGSHQPFGIISTAGGPGEPAGPAAVRERRWPLTRERTSLHASVPKEGRGEVGACLLQGAAHQGL